MYRRWLHIPDQAIAQNFAFLRPAIPNIRADYDCIYPDKAAKALDTSGKYMTLSAT